MPVGTNATASGATLSGAKRPARDERPVRDEERVRDDERPVRDVVVIGGGPAGAAVARGLALRGRDVVLLEATAFDAPRFGETIAPEGNPLLRELGVWDAFAASNALESPGTISAWGSPIPSETDFLRNRHGPGWHVDRNVFDALLCRAAAEAGVQVRTLTRVLRCKRAGGSWRVGTSAGDELRARFVIDASGRNGTRLADNDGRVPHDALIAIFLRLVHDDGLPADLRTLVESVADGWWYWAPVPSGETVAVFLTDPGLYTTEGVVLGEQLDHARLIRARIGRARIASFHVVHVPSSLRAHPVGDSYAAAGDAAASFDPVSGYGITKALDDARVLAGAVGSALNADPLPLRAYADRVRSAFAAYTVQRAEYYALERRWPEHTFWKKRVAAASEPAQYMA